MSIRRAGLWNAESQLPQSCCHDFMAQGPPRDSQPTDCNLRSATDDVNSPCLPPTVRLPSPPQFIMGERHNRTHASSSGAGMNRIYCFAPGAAGSSSCRTEMTTTTATSHCDTSFASLESYLHEEDLSVSSSDSSRECHEKDDISTITPCTPVTAHDSSWCTGTSNAFCHQAESRVSPSRRLLLLRKLRNHEDSSTFRVVASPRVGNDTSKDNSSSSHGFKCSHGRKHCQGSRDGTSAPSGVREDGHDNLRSHSSERWTPSTPSGRVSVCHYLQHSNREGEIDDESNDEYREINTNNVCDSKLPDYGQSTQDGAVARGNFWHVLREICACQNCQSSHEEDSFACERRRGCLLQGNLSVPLLGTDAAVSNAIKTFVRLVAHLSTQSWSWSTLVLYALVSLISLVNPMSSNETQVVHGWIVWNSWKGRFPEDTNLHFAIVGGGQSEVVPGVGMTPRIEMGEVNHSSIASCNFPGENRQQLGTAGIAELITPPLLGMIEQHRAYVLPVSGKSSWTESERVPYFAPMLSIKIDSRSEQQVLFGETIDTTSSFSSVSNRLPLVATTKSFANGQAMTDALRRSGNATLSARRRLPFLLRPCIN
jgi:hypothetical protein